MKIETLSIGAELCGFVLEKRETVAAVSAELYTLRHKKTGAELLYSARDDENKTFAIAFATLPEDSTGVFHILEHSVLNGSKKYPVKEPFVSLLQTSMQTFLNAMTFGDKTVYPVSSRNEQDFFNLMSVYLDGVFCPKIYERPEIFLQEGWHYAFAPDGEVSYNGVVFSEMKGAFSDVDSLLGEEAEMLLFPDTCYGHVSGGHPEHIPSLTYEQFIQTHKRFYHPSNAKIFLDGKLPLERVLAYLDGEYLGKYEYRAPDFAFAEQTPQVKEKTIDFACPQDEEPHAHFVMGKILCRYDDPERIYAAKILCDYLAGTNEAPLKRALLEKGLGQDISLQVCDGIYQPYLTLTVRNTEEEHFETVKRTVEDTARALAKEGLDYEGLSASLARAAFAAREKHEPYGLTLGLGALDTWLYGGDPTVHWKNAAIYRTLNQKLDSGYFEALLTELLGDSSDKSCLYALPSKTKAQEDSERERARVNACRASWNEEERKRTEQAYLAMCEWQKTPDSEEALATLPHLRLSDVSPRGEEIKTEVYQLLGRTVLSVKGDTNGILYLSLYFDVSDLTVEELRTLNLMTCLFGELGTENYDAPSLQKAIKTTFGSLDTRLEYHAKEKEYTTCTPYLSLNASLLEEKLPEAVKLLCELTTAPRYDEVGRIEELLTQSDYFLKQSLIGDGHSYAIKKALSRYSAVGYCQEQMEGESFLRWFSKRTASFKTSPGELCQGLAALHKRVFASSRLVVGHSGRLDDAALATLIGKLPVGECGPRVTLYEEGKSGDDTIEIPAGVGYSALGHNLFVMEKDFHGSALVLSTLISFAYLWNEVRVKGGAYGTGLRIRVNGDIFAYSYRDPHLKESRAAFASTADFVSAFVKEGGSVDDLIIGTVNTTDPLLSPEARCQLACSRYLNGTTFEDICRIRREILETTVDDFGRYIPALERFGSEGSACYVGSEEMLATVKPAP